MKSYLLLLLTQVKSNAQFNQQMSWYFELTGNLLNHVSPGDQIKNFHTKLTNVVSSFHCSSKCDLEPTCNLWTKSGTNCFLGNTARDISGSPTIYLTVGELGATMIHSGIKEIIICHIFTLRMI